MSSDPKSNQSGTESGTRMDLGDDLLQTRTILRAPREPDTAKKSPVIPKVVDPAVQVDTVDELLINSKILVSEGMWDEAKATLRRVLLIDPKNLTARDRLAEIQKVEIKKLLGAEENAPTSFFQRTKKKPEEHPPEEILAALEKEVGPAPDPEKLFFPDPKDQELFLIEMEKACIGASSQDRMDLGIGFLEMELYDVAVAQFRIVIRDEAEARKARGLLATALLAKGKAHEALMELEGLIADQSASAEEKIDFGYLAGQAQEKLGNFEVAAVWYRAVTGIENGYRDAQNRLVYCLKKCEKTPSSSSSPSSRS